MPAWLWWAASALILIVVLVRVLAWGGRRRREVRPPAAGEAPAQPPASPPVDFDECFAGYNTTPCLAGPAAVPPVDDNVQFTVYRPRAVVPDRWYTLVAFAHLAAKRSGASADEPDPVEEVRRQAVRVLGEQQARTHQAVTQDAPQPVPREETLTFVPDVPGVEFNPPLRSFRWTEAVHREDFRLRASLDLVGQTARGRLSVFLEDILLADVALAIPVEQPGGTPVEDAPQEAESAGRYRRIFASYSHQDLYVVKQVERLARALGDEYLRDWKNLRAGEAWDERLLQMIEEADVFQLFWSRHAMESAYVRREYEHALALNRPNFVRPTYWEDPLPTDPARNLPPEALLRLHFQRIGPFLLSAISRVPSLTATQADKRVTRPTGVFEIPGYMLLSELGRGRMGVVFKAWQTGLDRLVAVKTILTAGPEQLELFRREAEAVARLQHPQIVQIFEVGEHDGLPYLSLEYVEGGSLEQRLDGTPLPARQAAALVEVLALTMRVAHEQGIVHRDLRPANVLLAADGTPKITDFGFATCREDSRVTATGRISGTPNYMAPEQAAGKSDEVGPAADVHALGAILYELLTGRPPFRGDTVLDTLRKVLHEEPVAPSRLRPRLPRDLEVICLKCLHKEPQRRYGSAEALAEDLRRFLEHAPIRAMPVGVVERLWRWSGRHRLASGLLAAWVFLALTSALIAWILFFR
jgi:predicted Ser/Thr protein kinase